MPDIAELKSLLERVREASGPDDYLGSQVLMALAGWRNRGSWRMENVETGKLTSYGPFDFSEPITKGSSAVIALVEQYLPGWAWKIGTCSISDDAWLAPDFNCPVHGERLRAEFSDIKVGSIWDAGVDIDRRPSGNPALALLEALLTALIAKAEASAVREGV